MQKRGKRYEVAAAKIDRTRLYSPAEALTLAKQTVTVSYDPTINLAIRLGIDPRKADQIVRGSVALPNGIGKSVRVAVFAEGAKAAEAVDAGADIVGPEAIIAMVEAGNLDFDSVVATPDQMSKLGRYGRILGPRGLMPNPKTGTVTMDVAKAVAEIKAGRIDYRSDRQANVHLVLGKGSFEARKLVENYAAVISELIRVRPAAAKGRYIRTVHVASSQGPSIGVDPTRTRDFWEEAAA
ncbi:MAG: 50S ribosomal protein L1 [Egibacteraceae bacterium]